MRRWPASVVLLLGVLVLAGCSDSSEATGPAVSRTHSVRAAYAAAIGGLDRQYFDTMSMSGRTHLRQVLLVPGDAAGQFIAEWEGALAVGGTAVRLTRPARLTCVDVFEHAVGDGVPPDPETGFCIDAPPAFSASSDSDSEIDDRAESVLRDFHLTPTTIRVLHPYGPALFVQARTPDASSVAGRMGDLMRALDSGHRGLEGLYLAVDGPDGPLFRGETAHRIAEGGQWFARGFDSGIPHA